MTVLLAMLAACGPDTRRPVAGDYEVTKAGWGCGWDNPEAPAHGVVAFLDTLTLEQGGDGEVLLSLPMPPCPVTGWPAAGGFELVADDCVVEVAGDERVEAHSISYSDGYGDGAWHDGVLELRITTVRQFSHVLGDLPDWWDDPGSCSARYELLPQD